MSGSSPQPSKPYQGPQFGLQDAVLSNYVLGNMYGQNPGAFPGSQFPNQTNYGNYIGNGGQSISSPSYPSQLSPSMSTPQNSGLNNIQRVGYVGSGRGGHPQFLPPNSQPNNQNVPSLSGQNSANSSNSMMGADPYSSGNGFVPGQSLAGQINPITGGGGYQNYQFKTPDSNFSSRTPFQYGATPSINVADVYRPQYDMARNDILDQSKVTQEQLLSDMNRRGMLTSGAATKQMALQSQEQNRKLANLGAQYSIAQGQAQLQEDQMRRQMETQRQIEQAAEIFRQNGATDAQAQFLANQNFNVQNAQAGQNLQGFQTNLGAQNQRFNQQLQGRQQGTTEMQIANLYKRQPMEDLFRLWQQQAGPTGGTQGSPGILGALGTIGGAALGGAFGGPFGASLGGGIGGAAGGAISGLGW